MAKVKKMAFGGMGSSGMNRGRMDRMGRRNAPPPPQSSMQGLGSAMGSGSISPQQTQALGGMMQGAMGGAPTPAPTMGIGSAMGGAAPANLSGFAGLNAGTAPAMMKKGGAVKKAAAKKSAPVKKMASGGMTSASKRADGIAQRGKTRA